MEHNLPNDGSSGGAVMGLLTSISFLFLSLTSVEGWMRLIALGFSIAASIYTIKKNKKP